MNSKTHEPTERAAWPIIAWAKCAGISRSSAFELMAAGKIESVKFGRKRLVLTPPIDWLNSLKQAA